MAPDDGALNRFKQLCSILFSKISKQLKIIEVFEIFDTRDFRYFVRSFYQKSFAVLPLVLLDNHFKFYFVFVALAYLE